MPQPALTIASLIRSPALADACAQSLKGGRYQLAPIDPSGDPMRELDRRRHEFDAILLEEGAVDNAFFECLRGLEVHLPAVVIGPISGKGLFQEAEVRLPPDQLEQLSYSLDAARYLRRNPPPDGAADVSPASTPDGWMLSNRLNGRLGYLRVYYKRDPSRFLCNLEAEERSELLRSLTRTYRDLLISYFKDPAAANQAIESFVNTAFFADLPITKTVEIHMNLIEEFWKKLKLEGHKNDFLQEYRLALLDVIAHLCEMYRRSTPPDLPLLSPTLVEGASTSLDRS
jgi:circadian clock protein KaiA